VVGVTGGATAASRTASVPDDPAEPADRSEAVIRAVPSERPPRPALVPEPVTAPSDVPATPVPPESGTSAAGPEADRGPARPRARRGSGARERRRQETRERIVDAAADLFAERGFDAVSVMEIAGRAGVVEKTVFNHFPVKEGLVFESDPPIRTALLAAVSRRPAGESVAAAAGNFVVSAVALLGSPEAADGVAAMARVVRGSRTLQIREREILGELTSALAGTVAEETGAVDGALEPWLAAHAVLGLYAALLELARDRVLAGATGPALAAELRRRGERGLALLQFGLAGYAKRR
jgi:AcrR family transcriptional regulator